MDADFTYFLDYYKAQGAKGVGVICCNLAFDDPMVKNMFSLVEKSGLSLTFHIGQAGNDYGLIDEPSLPKPEGALKKFPKLIFMGHSQKFWAEISGDVTDRNGYPKGKVAPALRFRCRSLPQKSE